eukprot:CAMPEP_0204599512 /NCGR_PEP_ID=MMETSP0661-20131031/54868_1 /ASSEMBLY_ACC=CAM_ASM_000606 /TAXON_ID=109239 /ORGANISM="Alexandrium margalefi, Strain AMGDE01CS-322" /LENGTH=192 /DNA_ID=CAMNT_0051610245 /DNA_START=102 /DNA_END=681 /DNA_ORIENTATION=+
MSVLPPIHAFFGGGLPKFMVDALPAVSPCKALLGSVFLFNAPHMVTMYLKFKASKGQIDNNNPRAQSEKVKQDEVYGDIMGRALAAHQNGLESFPVLAAGVLACMAAAVDKAAVGKLACAHLLSRIAFNVCYILLPQSGAVGVARTVAWAASLLSSCQLIMLAGKKAASELSTGATHMRADSKAALDWLVWR